MNILLMLTLLGSIQEKTLYNSLDPLSVAQALTYFELYPATGEGKKALKRARELLKAADDIPIEMLTTAFHRFENADLNDEQIRVIEALSAHFSNRKLKGYGCDNVEALLDLDSNEIDLSEALLLVQGASAKKRRHYCALIDLMALQIQARLPASATPEEKIREMNRFVFEEMRFRFPPHSIYAKKIDHFTFLASVMDNHIGVCLGVTTLYLSLAQRLDLPLQIITPPGHIYVRYNEGGKRINIETTARGIDVPDEKYETVHVKEKLAPRTLKEVIGMTFVNQASIYWEEEAYDNAVSAYEKAMAFLQEDPFTNELLALACIVAGEKERGGKILEKFKENLSEIGEDFLLKRVDAEGIRAYFAKVDEKRESILAKQERLKKSVAKYPHFRSGIEQIAICYLQLHRPKEAILWLNKYHEIDETNPEIEYYLALLHSMRQDFEKAWVFLKNAEGLIKEGTPKALADLRDELVCHLPEP